MSFKNVTSLNEVTKNLEKIKKSLRNKPYMCRTCFHRFTQKNFLDQHMIMFHGGEPLKCQICLKQFKLKLTLDNHMKVDHKRVILKFRCVKCVKKFQQKCFLDQYIFHDSVLFFKCQICLKQFEKICSLNEHMKIHCGEDTCKNCEEIVVKEDQVNHITRNPSNVEPFSCVTSQDGFIQGSDLINHLKGHYGLRPNVQDEVLSNKNLQQINTLNKVKANTSAEHLVKVKQETQQTGPIWGEKFNEAEDIVINATQILSKEEPFLCVSCRKGFLQKSALTNHLRVHSGVYPNLPLTSKTHVQKNQEHTSTEHYVKVKQETQQTGPIWGEKFNGAEDIVINATQIISKEEPFLCVSCRKGFLQKSALTNHLRVHSGVHPNLPLTSKTHVQKNQEHTSTEHYEVEVKQEPIDHAAAPSVNLCDYLIIKKEEDVT